MGTTTEAPRREATEAPRPVAPATPWDGLSAAAARHGVPLSDTQLSRFDLYRRLLLERNARFNLTAIEEPEGVERRLFLDALLMVPVVDRLRAPRPGGTARLVDIGSGAGFPGLAIKIARPDLRVTLIEATGKKVAFLADAIAALELEGVDAVHARAEELGHHVAHRDRYDIATARAVASLPALLELGAPLLRVGGVALFPKGTGIEEEVAASRRAAPLLGVRLTGIDPLPGGTTLVRVEKVAPTLPRFPRRPGLPAREPLGVGRAERRPAREDRGRTGR